jgi:DNA-binding protein WhiA
MNFTADIKKEIISRKIGKKGNVDEKKAAFSAFVRTSGVVGIADGTPTFFLVSETENVAEFFTAEFSSVFSCELSVTHATMNKMSGRDKLVLQCPPQATPQILKELALLKRDGKQIKEGIARSLIKTDGQKIAYIKGAFLGGGSCTLPVDGKNVGYHLEIVFSDKQTARDFCDLLAEFELIAKLVERKETQVVYIKSKEVISDFLAVIGAKHALDKLTEFIQKRDASNNDNRAKNCFSGNADKSAIAAVKQVVAIKNIQEKTNFRDMSGELIALAKARLANPTMSLQELSNLLDVSKSCLNHRMRRLMEIAEEL